MCFGSNYQYADVCFHRMRKDAVRKESQHEGDQIQARANLYVRWLTILLTFLDKIPLLSMKGHGFEHSAYSIGSTCTIGDFEYLFS